MECAFAASGQFVGQQWDRCPRNTLEGIGYQSGIEDDDILSVLPSATVTITNICYQMVFQVAFEIHYNLLQL